MKEKEKAMEERLDALIRWRGYKRLAKKLLLTGANISLLCFLISVLLAMVATGPAGPNPLINLFTLLAEGGLLVGIGLIVAGAVLWMISAPHYIAHKRFVKRFVTASAERRREAERYLTEILSKKLSKGSESKDKNRIIDIIGVSGEMGNRQAVEFIIPALKDENIHVRGAAIEALGEIGDVRAIEPLVCILKDEKQQHQVRKKVAKALDKLAWKPQNDVERVWYLIAAMRWNEIVNLGESAVEPLIVTLKDKDPAIRISAARVLGEIKDARAVEPLTQALKDETNVDVRRSIKKALKKIKAKKS